MSISARLHQRLRHELIAPVYTGIGRRFSLTEGVCFLAKLVRGWRVERLAKAGETKAQWEARVICGRALMNFGIGDVPLRLVRRE